MLDRVRDGVFVAVSPRLFYGWVILAVAGLGLFASGPGQSHTFSVFVGPIAEDLGATPAEIASAYAVATLIAAFGLPFMGRLVDRHGPRRMTLVVALGLGLACIVFGAVSNLLLLGLGFAALRFLGQGSLMLNCANVVSQWFDKRRGFALSLMAMGFALSMAVHPPLSQFLVESLGWRQAWLALGLLTWLLLLPPVLLLLHDRPEDKGLEPDGGAGAAEVRLGPKPVTASEGLSLAEALRTPAFYLVVAGMVAIAMLVTVLHFYQVTIFRDQGLSARTASGVFAVSAVTMVVSMPLVGLLLDRLRTRVVFAMALGVQSAALLGATLVTDLTTAFAYALVFGLNNAFSITLMGYMWPRYFGRKHLGSIQGAGQTSQVVGASLGPPLVGFAAELTGGFTAPLQVAALLPLACAVAALLFLKTPPPLDRHVERD